MVAEMRIYGDPILRKKAESVKNFDKSLAELVDTLIVTMKQEDGVGLAAPQIGCSLRVAVIDPTGGEEEPLVLINPKITSSSEEHVDNEEGCLSIPGISLKVSRPSLVSVHAFDRDGNEYVIENAEGLLARALQHELDHLDGILFVDRVSPVARQLVAGKLKKLAKTGREKAKVA
ncbi:MAG: peptide deformylase [Chitinivibrionales bacterium]|nr:peptide deformylase [Chitinivibrionales bacterium]MBD3356615.1 peptide deformylase [Chitinivibrionales bacterium]